MKVAIVVTRNISRKEQYRVSQLLAEYPDASIFGSNTSQPLSFSTFIKPYDLEPDQKKKINYEIMDKVLQFGEKPIDGKSITDWLTFEQASLWHYHKFRIYFNTRNTVYELTKLKSIAAEFETVYFFGDGENLRRTGELPSNTRLINSTNKKRKNRFQLIEYALFFGLRVISSFFRNSGIKAKKHLLIDHSQKQICFDLKTLQPKKDNYNLGYLFDKVDNEFVILDEIEVVKPGEKNSGLFKTVNFSRKGKRNYINNEPILLKAIYDKSIRKERKKDSTYLSSFYKKLTSETVDPVEKLIVGFLMDLHKTSLFYLFKYRAYKHFFGKYSFKTVASIDENSPRIKVILDAAKSKGIKTIGIQHGAIHDLHPAYLFTKEDKARKIMSGQTLVWGKHWKHFLAEEGNYPENSLVETGQIRTDIIPKLLEKEGSMKLKNTKKIILFASQPQRDPNLRRRAAEDVFNSVKDIPNTQLIIKLHPAEKNDFDYYMQIAETVGCKNYELVYGADLYNLISESDIVVTCFSTVGAETTYFKKPLIILDHLKQDIQKYHEKGIAFQTLNSLELEKNIREILDGNLSFNEEAYSNYIREFAFKIDGKTAERVIKAIKKN